jgi:anti-sigma regulatory factor (Ser/Thr protein kinase)
MNTLVCTYEVPGDDFTQAGEASGAIKRTLKELGFNPEMIRRVAIATYEAEINMVIHANGGVVTATIGSDRVTVEFVDKGPGIPDVSLAMQEGWSTATESVRELGFGAGMGLPNIQKYTDEMNIDTQVGVGTTLTLSVYV